MIWILDSMDDLLKRISSFYLKEAYHFYLKESLAHIERVRRVERGYAILTQAGDYSIKISGRSLLKFEVTGPNGTYTIIDSQQSCSCPDSEAICKHRFAVKILLYGIKAMQKAHLEIAVK